MYYLLNTTVWLSHSFIIHFITGVAFLWDFIGFFFFTDYACVGFIFHLDFSLLNCNVFLYYIIYYTILLSSMGVILLTGGAWVTSGAPFFISFLLTLCILYINMYCIV